MTPTEMLKFCLEAFEAIPTAHASHRFIEQKGIRTEGIYGGTGSYKLAKAMQRQLREYLGEKP